MTLSTWYPVYADKTIHCDKTNFGGKRNIGQVDTIVIHYTGNNGDTAEANCKYFAGKNREASAHFFVDEKEICQSVFMDEIAWHVTGHNQNTIGIEMCSRVDSKGNFYIPTVTKEKAAKLAALISLRYGVDFIVRHYDLTKKQCPEPFVREPVQWHAWLNLYKNCKSQYRYEYSVMALEAMKFLTSKNWQDRNFDDDLAWLMHKVAANLPVRPLGGWK